MVSDMTQCLTETLERPYDFGEIATTSALFVAIASPHSKNSDPRIWNQPQLLIRTHGYRKKGSAASEQDGKILAELCKRFESVAVNLDIVTFCETEATTLKGLFGRPQFSSKILVRLLIQDIKHAAHSYLSRLPQKPAVPSILDLKWCLTSTQITWIFAQLPLLIC